MVSQPQSFFGVYFPNVPATAVCRCLTIAHPITSCAPLPCIMFSSFLQPVPLSSIAPQPFAQTVWGEIRQRVSVSDIACLLFRFVSRSYLHSIRKSSSLDQLSSRAFSAFPKISTMASLGSPPAGGDRNIGPALATTTIILDVLATISVLARLYVRSRVIKQIGFDDVLIVISLVSITRLLSSEYLGALTLLSR